MRRLLLSLTTGLALSALALEMPSFFCDDMILQREAPVPVWGTAPAGQRVTVEFGGATAEATAGADGAWLARLPAMPASKAGRELKVTADTSRTFRNVVVGDIWLCAGQSNMDWGLGGNTDGARLVKESANPQLRLLQIPHLWSRLPCRRFGEATTEKGQPFAGAPAWRVCGPQTSGGFAAVGYLMGRELQRELDIPIGLVKLAWGGCRVESMCAPDSFAQIPGLAGVVEHNRRLVAEMQAKGPDGSWQTDNETLYRKRNRYQRVHTALYNAMVLPLAPMAVRGMVWYQGEDNHYEGDIYAEKLKALAWTWRRAFANPEMPIHIVLLPPYRYNMKAPYTTLSDRLPVFTDAQRRFAESDPHAGYIVTTDCGNVEDIHPREKRPLSARLARMVLLKTYGRGDDSALAPTFRDVAFDGPKATVSFNRPNGLRTTDGKAPSFVMLAGADGKFVPADHTAIVGDTLVASAEAVPQPAFVSFGWSNVAQPNLVNRAGHPVMPFNSQRTGR